MKNIFLSSLDLGLKHKMFGDFVQRCALQFIVSKLFIDITTSEWFVKGRFQRALSFSRRYIHSWNRKKSIKIFCWPCCHYIQSYVCFCLWYRLMKMFLLFHIFFYNSHVYIFLLPFLLLSCFLQLYISLLLSRQEQEDFSLLQNNQTSTGAYWACCLTLKSLN